MRSDLVLEIMGVLILKLMGVLILLVGMAVALLHNLLHLTSYVNIHA